MFIQQIDGLYHINSGTMFSAKLVAGQMIILLTDTYDAVCCIGTLGSCDITENCFETLAAIVKPG